MPKNVRPLSKYVFLCLSCLGLLIQRSAAQAIPAANGPAFYEAFRLPTVPGTLRYSLSVSEQRTLGYNGGDTATSSTDLSGSVGFVTSSENHPLTLSYSGGYLTNTGPEPSSFFQSLSVAQSLRLGRWNFSAADIVSYLPNSATTGLSGIPGLGDAGLAPIAAGSESTAGVLTDTATNVFNTTSVSAMRNLTGSTSVQVSGQRAILRFLSDSGGAGLETNNESGSGGVTHRIDARNQIGGDYVYSAETYVGYNASFTSQGVNFEYTRQWTRKFTTSVSVGPQFTNGNSTSGIPSSLNVAADVAGTYQGKNFSGGFSYDRTTSGGAGVTLGGRTNNVTASGNRRLGRVWNTSGTLSYRQLTSLQTLLADNFESKAIIGSAQVSRALGRRYSVYASYTAERQFIQGTAAALDPINGTIQNIAVGLSYSPSPFIFGHR